jgi:hypothetical protein
MAAVVEIVGIYGPEPGTITPLTTQRYCTDDQRDPGLSYPNNVPAAGQTNRSYWVHTGARVTGGTYSQLTNWRWGGPKTIASDWGLGSGKVQVALKDSGDPGCPYASYRQAVGVRGQTGYDLKDPVNGHDYYKNENVPCANADSYGSSDPLVFDTSIITPESPSKVTKFVVHQFVLENDTAFGEKNELQCFIRWQEI